MKISDRIKLKFYNTFAEWFTAFAKGEDSGQSMTTEIPREVALKYSAIFACSRVLSETLASMPVFIYRKKENGRTEGSDIGLYDILHGKPNDEMTPFNFKESLMMNLCLNGNGIAQKLNNKRGELVALYPLDSDPAKIVIERNKESKRLTYEIRNGETQFKTRDEIFHIPGPSLNGITGLNPIAYAAKAIELGLTYEAFEVQFYKNGANTSMAISHPRAMSDNAYTRLKDEIDKKRTGLSNVNKPWLLEDGATIKELTIKPVDSQLLESKYFQIEDICRIYRVPLHLVQHLLRATNNNIEQMSLEFVMYTMLPWAKRWEENINLQLMTPEQRNAGYYSEFKMDSFLRGAILSRCQAYAYGRQWGWLSVNDIRRLENMDGIGPAGDIYLTPANMYEAGKTSQEDKTKALAEEIFKMIKDGDIQ